MSTCLKNMSCFFGVILIVLAGMVSWPEMAMADEDNNTNLAWIKKIWAQHFSFDLRMLTYDTIQAPANSSQNPENNFLRIPRYSADLEIRPYLRFTLDRLELSVNPE